jgi:hypothetical protein
LTIEWPSCLCWYSFLILGAWPLRGEEIQRLKHNPCRKEHCPEPEFRPQYEHWERLYPLMETTCCWFLSIFWALWRSLIYVLVLEQQPAPNPTRCWENGKWKKNSENVLKQGLFLFSSTWACFWGVIVPLL